MSKTSQELYDELLSECVLDDYKTIVCLNYGEKTSINSIIPYKRSSCFKSISTRAKVFSRYSIIDAYRDPSSKRYVFRGLGEFTYRTLNTLRNIISSQKGRRQKVAVELCEWLENLHIESSKEEELFYKLFMILDWLINRNDGISDAERKNTLALLFNLKQQYGA